MGLNVTYFVEHALNDLHFITGKIIKKLKVSLGNLSLTPTPYVCIAHNLVWQSHLSQRGGEEKKNNYILTWWFDIR